MADPMAAHVRQAKLYQQLLMLLGDHRRHPSCGNCLHRDGETQVARRTFRRKFDFAMVRMPEDAPSADELLARYPSRFPPNDDGTPCQLVTQPTVAAGWRDLFQKLSGHWA